MKKGSLLSLILFINPLLKPYSGVCGCSILKQMAIIPGFMPMKMMYYIVIPFLSFMIRASGTILHLNYDLS